MQIIDVCSDDTKIIRQVAALLVDSFKHWPDAWTNIDSALEEVQESLEQIESAEWQLMKAMQFWAGLAGLASTTGTCGNFILWLCDRTVAGRELGVLSLLT